VLPLVGPDVLEALGLLDVDEVPDATDGVEPVDGAELVDAGVAAAFVVVVVGPAAVEGLRAVSAVGQSLIAPMVPMDMASGSARPARRVSRSTLAWPDVRVAHEDGARCPAARSCPRAVSARSLVRQGDAPTQSALLR
jgi:hypothetical protein